MLSKSHKESFKLAYAMSLAGQLGFYIAIPFIIAIIGHNYMDKYVLDKYLTPGHHAIHLVIDCTLAVLVGIYSIWQIRKLIMPFINDK